MKHNALRREVHSNGQLTAANMRALVWDADLEAVAQAYAEGCVWQHNADRLSQYQARGGTDSWLGENIAIGTATAYSANQLIQAWYDEDVDYSYSSNSCASGAVCGHYTQMVWATTWRVGCGIHVCPTTQGFGGSNARYLVCNYAPGGNYQGQLPFISGPSCSQCPAGTTCDASGKLCVLGAAAASATPSVSATPSRSPSRSPSTSTSPSSGASATSSPAAASALPTTAAVSASASPSRSPSAACAGVQCGSHGQCQVASRATIAQQHPNLQDAMNGELASSQSISDTVAYCHCEEGWAGLRCDQGTSAGTCENNQKDDLEADVDCGGPVCDACGAGHTCAAELDCGTDAAGRRLACYMDAAGSGGVCLSRGVARLRRVVRVALSLWGISRNAYQRGGLYRILLTAMQEKLRAVHPGLSLFIVGVDQEEAAAEMDEMSAHQWRALQQLGNNDDVFMGAAVATLFVGGDSFNDTASLQAVANSVQDAVSDGSITTAVSVALPAGVPLLAVGLTSGMATVTDNQFVTFPEAAEGPDTGTPLSTQDTSGDDDTLGFLGGMSMMVFALIVAACVVVVAVAVFAARRGGLLGGQAARVESRSKHRYDVGETVEMGKITPLDVGAGRRRSSSRVVMFNPLQAEEAAKAGAARRDRMARAALAKGSSGL